MLNDRIKACTVLENLMITDDGYIGIPVLASVLYRNSLVIQVLERYERGISVSVINVPSVLIAIDSGSRGR
jgi:hypothetical protein